MTGFVLLYFVLCFLLLSFHTLSSNSSAPTKLCPPDQSFALIQFNNSLSIDCTVTATWCPYYNQKTNSWKVGKSCCLWDGVECETETGNVIGLDLSCSCLRGTLPSNSTLFLLHHLQELNLAYNDFDSSLLASEFGQFSNLTHLNISSSRFAGIIPLQISHLSNLLSLDLSSNYDLIFEGHVFEQVLRNLTQLRHLHLPGINMSSVLPSSFLNLSSYIMTLSLQPNGMQGKFPADVFRFPYLQKFRLISSHLEINFPRTNWSSPLQSLEVSTWSSSLGELPDSIGNLRLLEVLDLSHCRLKGSIPSSLGNLTKLVRFSLGDNELSGVLPFSVFNLPHIEYLDFSRNKLEGPLPNHVNGLSSLRQLYLDSNFLNGKIPSWLFTLPSLVELRLNDNKLSGFIIEQIDMAAPLERVSLQNNEIKGPIPSFSKLVNLTTLDLSSNRLNDIFGLLVNSNLYKLEKLFLSNNTLLSLPSRRANVNYSFPNLWLLNLSSCNLSEFPHFVRNLQGLSFLYLSFNKIRVIQPQMFSKLKSLESLDLSNNSRLSLSNNSNDHLVLPRLDWLSLSSCNLTQIPNFLTTQDNLSQLDLSRNFLTVLEYHSWTNMFSLNLRSNLLLGPLLAPPGYMSYFLISNNKLIGEIPSSICNLEHMEILDLSNNNLSGPIPECLFSGDIKSSLQVLDLQMNNFHGNIPDSFVEGNKLKTLNLNQNGLDGPFPKSLVNCHDLQVLNLGNNNINDTFPHQLGTLRQLQILVLRANYFHGQIIQSEDGSHFSSLRILDLSYNEFFGALPTTYFKSFKSMMDLSDVETGYMGDTSYYQDRLVITMKGVNIKFDRVLTIFSAIDISSNRFEGKIPEIVGKFTSLQVLNFSHNSLTGHIPSSIGNLAALESLDLSYNKLVGEIPMQLAGLPFLAVLNLSENQLVGLIPRGNQFDTFPNDSYVGNSGLCGFPLSKTCSKDKADEPTTHVFDEEGDSAFELDWKFVMMGYGVGLVFGCSAGYIMLTIGKPKWLVKMVQHVGYKVTRELKRYHLGR